MDRQKMGMDMTEGSVLRLMIRFTIPLLLANLIQQLYNSVDMMIVGKVVGNIGTVGVSTGGEIAALITFVAMSFGNAGQICAAQLMGAGKEAEIRELSRTVFIITMFMAFVFMVINICLCKSLLRWLNCPSEAFEQAEQYMFIVSFGLPFVFGYNAVCGIMRGMGESRWPLLFVFTAAIINIVLDIMLVIIIPLQSAGSAIATVAAQFISFAAAVAFMSVWEHNDSEYLKIKKSGLNKKYFNALLKIGIPLTVQSTSIHFSQLICLSWVNSFGLLEASANSIGSKVNRLLGIVTNSITGSCGSIIGQNLGAGKFERVRKTVYTAVGINVILCFGESAAALLLPKQFFSLFTNDTAVIEFGVIYMRILLITFLLSAVQGPYTSVITGSGNAKLSFYCGILDGIILRIGISYILVYVFDMGVIGYWYGNAFAHMGPVVISLLYFYSGRWRAYRIIEKKEGRRA